MNDTNNPSLTENARALRKNMTSEEKYLWYKFLKTLPYTIHRQKVLGNYIVDFYCAEAMLVIELDGSQHYSAEGLKYDKERDEYLKSKGIVVLRYSNYYFHKNFEGVCTDILRNIKSRSLRE